MEDQPSTISAELLSLTYGAFVSQIVKDYEDITEINKQIDLLGYNMGLRLVEDYLSKTHTRGIKSFQATCQDVASKAFPMYTGVEASVENWNSDEQSCILRFTNNPLTLYVEIPDELKGIHYSGVYCGVIRGALEMIHMKVECVFKEDMLLGAAANEIKIRFIEYLDDSTQYMLDDE